MLELSGSWTQALQVFLSVLGILDAWEFWEELASDLWPLVGGNLIANYTLTSWGHSCIFFLRSSCNEFSQKCDESMLMIFTLEDILYDVAPLVGVPWILGLLKKTLKSGLDARRIWNLLEETRWQRRAIYHSCDCTSCAHWFTHGGVHLLRHFILLCQMNVLLLVVCRVITSAVSVGKRMAQEILPWNDGKARLLGSVSTDYSMWDKQSLGL